MWLLFMVYFEGQSQQKEREFERSVKAHEENFGSPSGSAS
jgi:hypothetical protein